MLSEAKHLAEISTCAFRISINFVGLTAKKSLTVLLMLLFVDIFSFRDSFVLCQEPDNTPGDALSIDDQRFNTLDWLELEAGQVKVFRPAVGSFFEIKLTPERLNQLSPELRSDPILAMLAISRFLLKPRKFDLGVWGKVDNAGFFITSVDRISSYSRLYWVMIKSLSELYGCFMTYKIRKLNQFYFRCRDSRFVVFWRFKGDDFIGFYSRQYQKDGREIFIVSAR